MKVNSGEHLDKLLINCWGQKKKKTLVYTGISFPNKGGDSMLILECTAPCVMSYFSCSKPQLSKQMENLWLAVKSPIGSWSAGPHIVYGMRSCLRRLNSWNRPEPCASCNLSSLGFSVLYLFVLKPICSSVLCEKKNLPSSLYYTWTDTTQVAS